ncbi:hypothetical protein GCM10022221_56240 [Actinocorallia aurea]
MVVASVLPVIALSGWAVVGLALLSTGTVPPAELSLAAPRAEQTVDWAEVPEPTRVAAPRLEVPELTTAGNATPLSSRPGAVGGVPPVQPSGHAPAAPQDAGTDETEPQSAPGKPQDGPETAAEEVGHPAAAEPSHGPVLAAASPSQPASPSAEDTPEEAPESGEPAPHPATGHPHAQATATASPKGGKAGSGRARGPLRHLAHRTKACGDTLRTLWRCPNLPVSLRLP